MPDDSDTKCDWKSSKKIFYQFLISSAIAGKDKLGVPASEPVRLVLESDGTQVEDGEYFRTLANNTILLLLRQGERWYPTGDDKSVLASEFLVLTFHLSSNRC